LNLVELLDLGIRLEEKISACYEDLSRLCSDDALSRRLHKMAQEEINHANILRSGKQFLRKMPDVFGIELMTAGEIKGGFTLAEGLQKMIRQTSNLEDGLKLLLELEKRFEKVHFDTSIEIRDESLKKLFKDLSQEDQAHAKSLVEIISSLSK